MKHTLKAIAIAFVFAVLACAVLRAQGADDPPPPLTDSEKFTLSDFRGQVLSLTVAEAQVNQDAEAAMKEARDKILKEREDKLSVIKSRRDVAVSKFNELYATKKKDGWKIDVDKGMTWVKESPKTETVGPTGSAAGSK